MRLDELRLDLRYLMASVRRSKAFFATTILTFGLGIGVTTAMVSATYGVLVRPLPYPQSGRLVQLWEEHPGSPTNPAYPPMANTTFYAWRARLQSLEMIGLFGRRDFTVRLGDESFRLQRAEVSPAIFDILRATPQRGRFFIPADDVPGHHDFIVLSDRLWRDRFNASSDIVGQSIDVDGRLHTIVGIAAPGFAFPADGTLMWTPFDDPTLTDPKTQGGVWMGNALGRMRAGVTAEAVASEGTAAARSIPRPPVLEALLGKGGPVEMHARPLIAQQTDAVRPAMLVLLAGVVIVLLVGCVNVANLMLARGLARKRELGVRVALGASRERLLRQLVTENGVLAAAGGVAGLLFAAGLITGGRILAGPSIPRLNDVSVDGTTISIAMALSIAVAMVAGLWPAWRATTMNIAVALRGADGAIADGFRSRASHELRRLLLIGETALAVLLLVVARPIHDGNAGNKRRSEARRSTEARRRHGGALRASVLSPCLVRDPTTSRTSLQTSRCADPAPCWRARSGCRPATPCSPPYSSSSR